MKDKVRVTFLPQKVTLDVAAGSSVLDTALEAKLQIPSSCGGRGICGQCRVKVSESPAVTEVTETERYHLSKNDIEGGYRLACQTYLREDARVEVLPTESSRYQFQIHGITREFEKEPAVKKYRVKLKKPTLEKPISDDILLLKCLDEQHKLTRLRYHPNVLRTLSNIRFVDSADVIIWEDEIIDVRSALDNPYGIAIDVGTTKVACYIMNLATYETLVADAIVNPQRAYGDDVISRLTFEAKSDENWKALQDSLVQGINRLIESLSVKAGISSDEIYEAAVVGNTVMHHTFLGIHPVLVGRAPYSPTVGESTNTPSESLGLSIAKNANVYLPPNIAGFVGADCVAGILSTGLYNLDGLNLLVDIGTNTEISLGNNRSIYSCSCASGPAFEGYNITHGMGALEGAIEKVSIDKENYDVKYQTIGNTSPIGICGSGIIDCIAELLRAHIIDERGYFHNHTVTGKIKGQKNGKEFVLVPSNQGARSVEITIKQTDIREIQLAKAAIYAGIRTLMKRLNVETLSLDRIFVAGAFGSYINLRSAQMIGMLPDISINRFVQVGNSAGAGARQMLLSRKSRLICEKVAREVSYIELANESNFKDEYIRAAYLPHKDLSEFPNAKRAFVLE